MFIVNYLFQPDRCQIILTSSQTNSMLDDTILVCKNKILYTMKLGLNQKVDTFYYHFLSSSNQDNTGLFHTFHSKHSKFQAESLLVRYTKILEGIFYKVISPFCNLDSIDNN